MTQQPISALTAPLENVERYRHRDPEDPATPTGIQFIRAFSMIAPAHAEFLGSGTLGRSVTETNVSVTALRLTSADPSTSCRTVPQT